MTVMKKEDIFILEETLWIQLQLIVYNFFDSMFVGGSIAVIDVNDDGVKDIVATTA